MTAVSATARLGRPTPAASRRVRWCRATAAAIVAIGAGACVQVAPVAAETPIFGLGNAPSFAPPVYYDNKGARSQGVAIGDLDGDGKPDLATVIRSEGLAVFLGTGNGSFGPVSKYPASPASTSSNPFTIAVAISDLNADGRPDVVSAAGQSDIGVVWLGTGGGAFAPASRITLKTPGCSSGAPCDVRFPFDVLVADFSEDGKPDVATSNGNSDNLSVALGNGDGTFAPATALAIGGADFPQGMATADINKDGHLDLAVANVFSSDASVLLGHGDGTFGPATRLGLGSGDVLAEDAALADVNEDGNVDLVTANANQTTSILFGNGAGGFAPAEVVAVPSGAGSVVVADVNADDHVDLTLFDQGLSVLTGDGGGGFAPAVQFAAGGGDSPKSFAVGDLNADGRPDIATAIPASAAVSFTQDVAVLLNTTPPPTPATAELGARIGAFLELSGGSAHFGTIKPTGALTAYFATAQLTVRSTSPGLTVYVTKPRPDNSLGGLGLVSVQPTDQSGSYAQFTAPHPVFASSTAVNETVPVNYRLEVPAGTVLTKGTVYSEPIVYTATSPLP